MISDTVKHKLALGYFPNVVVVRHSSIRDSREMVILKEFEDEKIAIVWNNLTVSVPRKRGYFQTVCRKFRRRCYEESTTILKGVSGHAVTGSLIAVMGPSGAGKTTFMATIGGRIAPTAGSVNINGQRFSRDSVAKISSYLPQTDVLPSSLTVEEHLLFTCALKMDANRTERTFLSMRLLMELGLYDCKSVPISTISGGQRKRLSLATELITKPKLLFLDEPTTGLDTFSSMQVVQALRSITINFETIVFCTIHQPGMDIYSLFTNVLLLSDGRVTYSGSLGDATKFFSNLGYKCPVGFDESEYYIKIISQRNVDCEDSASTEHIDTICRLFSQSPLSRLPEITYSRTLEINPQRKANCLAQFYWLMWRMCVQNRRGLFNNWIPWLSYFVSMTLVAIFYTGIDARTQKGVQNTRGALYMMSAEISFTVIYSVIYEFPSQLSIYLRENGVYGSGPYYLATFLGLILKSILKALIFAIIMYFVLTSHIDLPNFSLYCLTTSAAAICGIAYGLMISILIDDIDVATSIMVPIDMTFLLTAGMFYNLRSLPAYLTSFKYFSIFFYLNEALSIIYWSRIDDIDCETSSGLPCLRNGKAVLSEYGFEETNFIWDMTGLAMLTIAMSLAGYFGLKRKRKVQTML